MVKPSRFYGQTFVVLWSNLRGFMVKPSRFYGQTFVVLWSNLRGFVVKPSWFRGFMVKPSWFYGHSSKSAVTKWRCFSGKSAVTKLRCSLGTCPGNRYAHGAIQRFPKVFMDFQVCSGIWTSTRIWFEGGVGIYESKV